MEIIILGSSAAIPVKNRNLSSTALKYRNHIILFDCGEDIQRNFNNAGLKFNKPMKILISHFHGDHIIGLPGLLFRFTLLERTSPIVIFGPKNLFLYLLLHKQILGFNPKYPIKIVEINHDDNTLIEYEGLDSEIPKNQIKLEDNIVCKNKRFIIKYTLVNHSVPTYAYSFLEMPRFGKFDPEKAREFGIPESHLWKKMQKGEVVDFNGIIIDPIKEKIVGAPQKGRKVTYSGDTAPCDSLIELGKDSDVLIHESTFAEALQEIAVQRKHSTSIDAANDAKIMNAKQLILTHISSRYQESSQKLLEEAKRIFPNTILASDLLKITVK